MGVDIVVTAAVRTSVSALRENEAQRRFASERLATGSEVNRAEDDPSRYFTARSLDSRSATLVNLLDDMSQAVQTLATADNAMSAIAKFVQLAQGKASAARVEPNAERRATLANEFNAILRQIEGTAKDATFKGKSLLAGYGNDLSVAFDEDNEAKVEIRAVDYRAANNPNGLSIADASNAWASDADIDLAFEAAGAALIRIRSDAADFGSKKAMIENRSGFARTLANALKLGSENLVRADLNEEGARLLALQTRQSLSTSALSLSNGAEQDVMRLFGG